MTAPRHVDTHCHVQFQAFRMDGPQVIREALSAGVWMIVVGTQSTTSTQAVTAAERAGAGVFASVGLHPNHLYAMSFDEDESPVQTREERFDPDLYGPLAENPKVVAIGECGLDLYRLPEGMDRAAALALQKEQFRLQVSFADANDLPVIVHCRDAHEELLAVLKSVLTGGGLKRRGVVHSFTAGWDVAERYLDMGFRLGFNGIITFPSKKGDKGAQAALLETVAKVPSDAFLLETDAPYLAPVPRRGERNRPEYVVHVAEKMAEARGLTVDRLAAQGVYNAQKLFHRMKA